MKDIVFLKTWNFNLIREFYWFGRPISHFPRNIQWEVFWGMSRGIIYVVVCTYFVSWFFTRKRKWNFKSFVFILRLSLRFSINFIQITKKDFPNIYLVNLIYRHYISVSSVYRSIAISFVLMVHASTLSPAYFKTKSSKVFLYFLRQHEIINTLPIRKCETSNRYTLYSCSCLLQTMLVSRLSFFISFFKSLVLCNSLKNKCLGIGR